MDGQESSYSKRSRMSLVDSIKDGPVVEKKAPPQKREKGKGKKGPAEKNIIRIGIIGFRGVGKSSLLDRFISGDEIDRSKNVPTIGYDEKKLYVEINGSSHTIIFYDMGGQRKYFELT